MKVIEKGPDRTAEAHIHVEGRVHALEEYGQYIDAHDRAICCYVAVEEGDKIRLDGRFSGMTLIVAYDVLVDGVCRKANSYVGKSVQVQKKRLDFETFLYQTPDGVIDTHMSVAAYSGPTKLNKEAVETVGTIELRVYITRQFDVEHNIDDAYKYDKVKEDADTSNRVATYRDALPQFEMTFEKNCSTLDASKGNRERKKVYAKRPGREPWAIFRFHYRTKESIADKKMDLTFKATDKKYAKQEPHALELDPVPVLLLGSKPAGKNDGENSARASSPPPPDTPSTPMKSSKKAQSAQPKVIVRKQQTKSTPVNSISTLDMAPTTITEFAAVTEHLVDMVPDTSTANDLQPSFTEAKNDSSTATAGKTASDNMVDNDAPAATKDSDGDLAAIAPKKSIKKVAKKTTEATDEDAEKINKQSIKKDVLNMDDKKGSEMADAVPQTLPMEVSNTPAIPHPADLPSVFDTPTTLNTAATQATVVPSTKDFVKNGTKAFTSPLKKPAAKPAAIDTTTSPILQKPIVPPAPATPLKRAPEGTLTPPPDVKRIKANSVPPLTPTHLSRPSSSSLSPRALSIEAQVAEQRKRLEATRKQRSEMAKKKSAMEERLAPYKRRMAEELERLRQETAEEEAMMAEDEEEYETSAAMLAEFEHADDEV